MTGWRPPDERQAAVHQSGLGFKGKPLVKPASVSSHLIHHTHTHTHTHCSTHPPPSPSHESAYTLAPLLALPFPPPSFTLHGPSLNFPLPLSSHQAWASTVKVEGVEAWISGSCLACLAGGVRQFSLQGSVRVLGV